MDGGVRIDNLAVVSDLQAHSTSLVVSDHARPQPRHYDWSALPYLKRLCGFYATRLPPSQSLYLILRSPDTLAGYTSSLLLETRSLRLDLH